jgi:hypothetical protein
VNDLGRAASTLARTFGIRGAAHRALFELRRATGLLRDAPHPVRVTVESAPIPPRWPFLPDQARLRAAADVRTALDRANRVLAGQHQAYRWTWEPRPRDAGAWRALERSPAGAGDPWWGVAVGNGGGKPGSEQGSRAPEDIKDSWEPGRFAWGYDLVRAWMLTHDDRYAEEWWTSLEAFIEACPPFRGVQWSCGQETAIRAIALMWAEGALVGAPSSTLLRLGRLRSMLAWSGERIADAIGYALSQRNNHGISEAAGLIAIGARLRGSDSRADRWIASGIEHLEWCVCDQFEEDGWYLQHSFNYLRVALDQLVVAWRVLGGGNRDSGIGRWHPGYQLSAGAMSRVRAAVGLLAEVVEPATGEAPLHGANDGAWVLPLSTAAYRDMRPALTAAAATFDVPLRADIEPDEETLAWLRAASPRTAAAPPVPRVRSGTSGWVHAVAPGASLFARAGTYRSRPGHIDALHVDFSIGGREIARDAGTYRYAAPAPWRNGLAGEDVHNTLTLAGLPMARRGPRFLWLSWPRARVLEATLRDDGVIVVQLANESWEELGVSHTRTCEVQPAGVLVVDRLTMPNDVHAKPVLHWLVDGAPDDISILATGKARRSDVIADRSSVRGWISEGYGHKRGARSVQVTGRVEDGKFVAVTGFGACRDEELVRERLEAERAR